MKCCASVGVCKGVDVTKLIFVSRKFSVNVRKSQLYSLRYELGSKGVLIVIQETQPCWGNCNEVRGKCAGKIFILLGN